MGLVIIKFEGPQGCGKSTAMDLVRNTLARVGMHTKQVEEHALLCEVNTMSKKSKKRNAPK